MAGSTSELSKLTAREVMLPMAASVRPGDPLEAAERVLVDERQTGVAVLDSGKLVGVLSRSDVTRTRVLAESLDGQIAEELHWDETQADGFKHAEGERFLGFVERLDKLRVKDVMRSQVVSCTPETPVAEVAGLLVQNHIHRVFVLEGSKPVGVVNSLDLVKLLAR